MAKVRSGSLRRAFILYVLTMFALVVLLSGAAMLACHGIRTWLLPDPETTYLTIRTVTADGESVETINAAYLDDIGGQFTLSDEGAGTGDRQYSIEKVSDGLSYLTPKRRLLYQTCGVLMVVLPAAFSVGGVLICGFAFYKRRMEKPLDILSNASARIAAQDLDMEVSYDRADEFGALCRSFEQMRQALAENNREMWDMLEQRRRLQASVAHDLRNPITIIEGYTEYLSINYPKGRLTPKKVVSIADNLHLAAKRLDQYTETIRNIGSLEELEVTTEPVELRSVNADITADFALVAEQNGLTLTATDRTSGSGSLDRGVYYRVLENLLSNAVRYAKAEIHMEFDRTEHLLRVTVTDDGSGYAADVLSNETKYFQTTESQSGHLGIGLTICRILTGKHGGTLELSNSPGGGAAAKVSFQI